MTPRVELGGVLIVTRDNLYTAVYRLSAVGLCALRRVTADTLRREAVRRWRQPIGPSYFSFLVASFFFEKTA